MCVKPMNCPCHVQIFRQGLKSYRELPLRWAELGTVYRYERSGVLHGMLRVRGFTQDDAHIFCTPEQLHEEIAGVVDLVDRSEARALLADMSRLPDRQKSAKLAGAQLFLVEDGA